MIQVITHNGLPPAQGGLRLGYTFSQPDGSIGVVPASLARLLAPKPAKVVPTPAAPSFWGSRAQSETTVRSTQRRHPIYMDARCPECGYLNGCATDPVQLGMIDCELCGEAMEVCD